MGFVDSSNLKIVLSKLKALIDPIDNKATAAKSSIDNMKIGARNLVLNSADLEPTSAFSKDSSNNPTGYFEYARYDFPKTFPFYDTIVGETVSISFDVEYYHKEGTSFYISVYDSNISPMISIGSGAVYKPLVGELVSGKITKQRFGCTRNIIKSNNSSTTRGIEFYCGYGSGNYFIISNIKIERGNKITDWTLAPEDVNNDISDMRLYIDTQDSKMLLKTSTLTGDDIDAAFTEVFG